MEYLILLSFIMLLIIYLSVNGCFIDDVERKNTKKGNYSSIKGDNNVVIQTPKDYDELNDNYDNDFHEIN